MLEINILSSHFLINNDIVRSGVCSYVFKAWLPCYYCSIRCNKTFRRWGPLGRKLAAQVSNEMAFKEILGLWPLFRFILCSQRPWDERRSFISPWTLSRNQSNEAKGSWTSVSKTTRQTLKPHTHKNLTLPLKIKVLYLHACMCTCLHEFIYAKYMQVPKEARRGYWTSRNMSLWLWGLLTKSVSSQGALSAHNHWTISPATFMFLR